MEQYIQETYLLLTSAVTAFCCISLLRFDGRNLCNPTKHHPTLFSAVAVADVQCLPQVPHKRNRLHCRCGLAVDWGQRAAFAEHRDYEYIGFSENKRGKTRGLTGAAPSVPHWASWWPGFLEDHLRPVQAVLSLDCPPFERMVAVCPWHKLCRQTQNSTATRNGSLRHIFTDFCCNFCNLLGNFRQMVPKQDWQPCSNKGMRGPSQLWANLPTRCPLQMFGTLLLLTGRRKRPVKTFAIECSHGSACYGSLQVFWWILQMFFCDWTKTFDKTTRAVVIKALVHFAVPPEFACLIDSACAHPCFSVVEVGVASDWFPQGAGIRQGCSLILNRWPVFFA